MNEKRNKFLNSTSDDEDSEVFRNLARNAMEDFSNVSDYIWKIPKFIEHEVKLGREKLEAYFPMTGDPVRDEKTARLRDQRWFYESQNLFGLFPRLMKVGNLFSTLAMFEAYCLRLARLIEERSKFSIESASGRGVSRIFRFLSIAGVNHIDLDYVRQVEAAIMIRNCLIHAEGLLSWDKNEKSLRRIISKATYLSEDHLQRRKNLGREPDEVVVFADDFGDRIEIDNAYPHVVTTYVRGYLISAAREAHNIYVGVVPS